MKLLNLRHLPQYLFSTFLAGFALIVLVFNQRDKTTNPILNLE